MELEIYDAQGRVKERSVIPIASGQIVEDSIKIVTGNITTNPFTGAGQYSGAFMTIPLVGDGVNGMVLEFFGFAPYIQAGTASHYEFGIFDTTIAAVNQIAAQQMPPNAVGITSGVLFVRAYIPPFSGTKNFHLACASGAAQTITLQASAQKPAMSMARWATPVKNVGSSFPPPVQWFAPTYTNSWGDYGAPYGPVNYCKAPDGTVFIRGLAQTAAATGHLSAFTLPSGYRPARTLIINALSSLAGGTTRMDIGGDGTVFLPGQAAIPVGWLSMTVSFMAEQ